MGHARPLETTTRQQQPLLPLPGLRFHQRAALRLDTRSSVLLRCQLQHERSEARGSFADALKLACQPLLHAEHVVDGIESALG
jgi:hypothetical protein